jgi:hypothetical protein
VGSPSSLSLEPTQTDHDFAGSGGQGWRVGLKRFPIDLEDYLTHPGNFDGEDAECYQRDIEQWKADRRCVLRWGNDHHLDKYANSI